MSSKKKFVTIMKEDAGYSASTTFMNHSIHTDGESLSELITNILEAMNLALEDSKRPVAAQDLSFRYDLKSFFAFYRVLNAKALSARIGMNQSLLAQYISGKKKPSEKQTRRILQGVKRIGKELTEIDIISP